MTEETTMTDETRVDGSCRDCRWFVAGGRQERSGKCKCGPPSVGATGAEAVWPRVRWNDWCGQYRPGDGEAAD